MSHWMRACVIFLVLAYLAPARAAEVPFLSGRVVDNAEILQPVTRSRLTIAIRAHEQHTTDQIVVLTVPTIGDMSVEEFATKFFDTW
ncbi:MAG: TPM domain-containing protein [Steroidobacteraceae bacterium]